MKLKILLFYVSTRYAQTYHIYLIHNINKFRKKIIRFINTTASMQYSVSTATKSWPNPDKVFHLSHDNHDFYDGAVYVYTSLGCSRPPAILNLHFWTWETKIVEGMASLPFWEEVRSSIEVTHLALARTQNRRLRHFGCMLYSRLMWMRRLFFFWL